MVGVLKGCRKALKRTSLEKGKGKCREKLGFQESALLK